MNQKNNTITADSSLNAADVAKSTINTLTAHVVGALITEQLIDPLSDEMDVIWTTIEAAVDRVIDQFDPIQINRIMTARRAAAPASSDTAADRQ